MNAFMVVLRCFNDDIPILLTADEEEALRIAAEADEDSISDTEEVLSIDHSEASNVSVWDFVDGKLTRARVIRDL